MLLNPCGKNTPNPGMQIVNAIMSCLDVVPPEYAKIRKIVCETFGISPHLVLDKGVEYTIVYMSPLVDRVSHARFVLIGEIHNNKDMIGLIDATRVANQAALKQWGRVKNSVLCVEWGEHRLENNIPIPDPKRWVEVVKIPQEIVPHISLYGWDDPHSRSSRCVSISVKINHIAYMIQSKQGKVPERHFVEMLQLREELKRYEVEGLVHPDKRFPERTKAMRLALEEAQKRMKQRKITGNVLLLAGVSHLDERFGTRSLSVLLSVLYDFLKTIPAIVIYPKLLDETFFPYLKSVQQL